MQECGVAVYGAHTGSQRNGNSLHFLFLQSGTLYNGMMPPRVGLYPR